MSASPLIYVPGRARRPVAREAPGRKMGKPAGSHIDELAALRKAIVLCWACRAKFDHKRARYYREGRFHVHGTCDGCRGEHVLNATLFVHESTVVQNGKSRHGNSWLPG